MTKQIGQFEIKGVLGGGGMATVYRGEHVSGIGMDAAIKKLHPHLALDDDLRARLKVEAQALSRLNHPNIVQIFDYVDVDGDCALVTELVEGATLRDLMTGFSEQPMPLSLALGLFRQILDGMRHAHQQDCLHRDLKPGNIMITSERLVKILDFGIASLIDTDRVTRTGVALGTPVYMAPEQLSGAQDLNAQTDIYALGIVLWEMLAGPSARPRGERGWRLTTEQVDQLAERDVPAPLVEVVHRLVEEDRSKRYTDCDQVFEALNDLLEQDCLDEDSRLVLSGRGPVTSGMQLPKIDLQPGSATEPLIPITQTVVATTGQRAAIAARRGSILAVLLLVAAVAAALWLLPSESEETSTVDSPTSVEESAPAAPSQEPGEPVAPPAQSAPPTRSIALTLQSEPAGAALSLDGEEMGNQVVTTMIAAVEKGYILTAQLDGYQPGKTMCRINARAIELGNFRCVVHLEQAARAAPEPRTRRPKSTSRPARKRTAPAPAKEEPRQAPEPSAPVDKPKIHKID